MSLFKLGTLDPRKGVFWQEEFECTYYQKRIRIGNYPAKILMVEFNGIKIWDISNSFTKAFIFDIIAPGLERFKVNDRSVFLYPLIAGDRVRVLYEVKKPKKDRYPIELYCT